MTISSKNPAQQTTGPWHPGEVVVQTSIGVQAKLAELGKRVVRSFMPDQHRAFYQQLPFLVAGVTDSLDNPWATLLVNRPGFVQSPDPKRLKITVLPDQDDPAAAGFEAGASIGFLGIELHTRRRNRINGVIHALDPGAFSVDVTETMGNCPKYIQLRDYEFVDGNRKDQPALPAQILSPTDVRFAKMITQADTFFVASFADVGGQRKLDASHRGGPPGFVKVDADGTLTIPDVAGNQFFNTLGNILLTGKAGLVFVDFTAGSVLQLTGTAEVVLESEEIARFTGAQRLWKVRPTQILYRQNVLPIRWQFQEAAPQLRSMGPWQNPEASIDPLA